MTLITLNIWGGYLKAELLAFFKANKTTDIFCLQEVYHDAKEKISTCDMPLSLDIFNDIAACLPDHRGYFCSVWNNYGLAIFINKKYDVTQHEKHLIHQNDAYVGKGPTHQRFMQIISYQYQNQLCTICNVHGLWNGQGKTDSAARICQSENIKKYIDTITNPFILCGDFNLEPTTTSLSLIAADLTDHIALHQITSTRTSYYHKAIKYADYVFTSDDIFTTEFKVLVDEVSDHAPLYLDYQIAQ